MTLEAAATVASRTYRSMRVFEISEKNSAPGKRITVERRVANALTEQLIEGSDNLLEIVGDAVNCKLGQPVSLRSLEDQGARISQHNPNIVVFPLMRFEWGSGEVEMRLSCTVCSGRSRSKIWVRLTEFDIAHSNLSLQEFTDVVDSASEATQEYYWRKALPIFLSHYEVDRDGFQQTYDVSVLVSGVPTALEKQVQEDLTNLDNGDMELERFLQKYRRCYSPERTSDDELSEQNEEWFFVEGEDNSLSFLRQLSLTFNPLSKNSLTETKLFLAMSSGGKSQIAAQRYVSRAIPDDYAINL